MSSKFSTYDVEKSRDDMYDKLIAIGVDVARPLSDCPGNNKDDEVWQLQKGREVAAYRIYHAALEAMKSSVYVFEALDDERSKYEFTLDVGDLWKSSLTPWEDTEVSLPPHVRDSFSILEEEREILKLIASDPERIKLRSGWPYFQHGQNSHRITRHAFDAVHIRQFSVGYTDTYFKIGTEDNFLFQTDNLPASFRIGTLQDAFLYPAVKRPFIIDSTNNHGPFSIHPLSYISTSLTSLSHIANRHYRLKQC